VKGAFDIGFHKVFSLQYLMRHLDRNEEKKEGNSDKDSLINEAEKRLNQWNHTPILESLKLDDAAWTRRPALKTFTAQFDYILNDIASGEKLKKIHKRRVKTIPYDQFIGFVKEYIVLQTTKFKGISEFLINQIYKNSAWLEKIQILREAIEESKGWSITAGYLEKIIKEKHPGIKGLGSRTISYFLKDLHYTYWKASVTYLSSNRNEIDWNIEWFIKAFKYFNSKGCWFIFIDEVAFNSRGFAPYTWHEVGNEVAIKPFKGGANTNAICALLDTGINFCKFRRGTNNGKTFT